MLSSSLQLKAEKQDVSCKRLSEFSSPTSPIEHYEFCRALLGEIFQTGSSSNGLEFFQILQKHPFSSFYIPSQVALALSSHFLGSKITSLDVPVFSSGLALGAKDHIGRIQKWLPLGVLAELSVLLAFWGIEISDELAYEKAVLLGFQVHLLLSRNTYFLCRERDWDQVRVQRSYSFLSNWLETSNVKEKEENPFFEAILKKLPAISSKTTLVGQGYSFLSHNDFFDFQKKESGGVFTLNGWNTGLGGFELGSVEIRSFGPQNVLDHSLDFGVASNCWIAEKKESSFGGWVQCLFDPEVWLEIEIEIKPCQIFFSYRFIGLKTLQKAQMSFYIRAKTCKVEGKTICPCTLQRYSGLTRSIFLDESFKMEFNSLTKVQVIPLAEKDCFWGSSFLLACEVDLSRSFSEVLFALK